MKRLGIWSGSTVFASHPAIFRQISRSKMGLLAHLSMMCSRWVIVIDQCPSSVVWLQQFALNDYSSYTPGPISIKHHRNVEPAPVAQLDAPSDWRPGGRGFNPRRGRQHSFVEIDHEIFSTVILSLPLIREGQLSVSGERMCTILVNRLED